MSPASPLDDLASLYDEYKYGIGKNRSIIRSSSAIVSVVASALLGWILFRSRNGIKTTHHRLLLGLSISDILYSLSLTTFGAVVPKELDYAVWNAQGSQASCDAFGFLNNLGAYSGLLYMCSLNFYYLAKVKFNKTDFYIAKKLELWLHLVPTSLGLIMSATLLVKQRTNATINGSCTALSTYDPPHCNGYDDGDTPEGFEIPCGRGRSAEPMFYVTAFFTLFLVPITIGGSLWTIYRSVSRVERRIARYGAGALQTTHAQPTTNDAATTDVEEGGGGNRGVSRMLSRVSSRFGGLTSAMASAMSPNNQDSSQSRAVLQKATAYSVGYFVTWIWIIIYGILTLARAWTTDPPPPKWQIAYLYAYVFFTPLQGLWTFLIYMQPNVIKRKRSSDGAISWFGAFADAFLSAVTGHTYSARCGRNQAGPGAPRTAVAPGRAGSNPDPAAAPRGRKASAAAGSANRQGDRAPAAAVGLEAEDPEEEKREIREDDPPV